jgi:hypothetical protein
VKVYTDNQNIVRIVNKGSTKPPLQNLARKIFDRLMKFQILLEVSWIPRDMNSLADAYSKEVDWDDWGVNHIIFSYFNSKWGPFDIDRFAHQSNTKLQCFNSFYWCPGTSGVDAFAFNWEGVNNWLVPPVRLVTKVLKHLITCKAHGTLVVPKWESSMFWPFIIEPHNGQFKYFIKDFVEYQKPTNFFTPGSVKDSVFAVSPFVSNVLVLKVDARQL